MKRMDIIGAGVMIPLVSLQAYGSGRTQKPNIIYIVTDQQTATAMSCAGNQDIHTPNMDRLASMGVRFNNAYCSSPLSGPSRTSMYTGHFSHEIGVETNGFPMPDSVKTRTLGTLLANAGYECIYAGKWHAHTPDMPEGEFGFHTIWQHNDIGLAEASVKFLEEKHKKPFFLSVNFDNPHNICEFARQQNLPWGNIEVPPVDSCPSLPVNFERNPHDADAIVFEQHANHRAYPTTHYTEDDWRRYRYAYFALVEKVDAEIGKILEAVDDGNLWKDTIVIFTSDHGDGVGAHHWNQKSALYEEVVNIPLIVVTPGQNQHGTVLPQLINNGTDIFTTICDYAGIGIDSKAHGQTGVSFRRLAESADPTLVHQDFVVCETLFDKGTTRGWMVRTQHYKYVIYDYGRYREQLFDMDTDRGEMHNLAADTAFGSILRQHRAILNDWMLQHNTRQIRAGLRLVPGY